MCRSFRPKVSVIIPTLGKILEECLISLSKQTYDNYEVIIVSDNPKLRLSKELFPKDRIKIIYNKGKVGISRARNIGITISEGDIVAFLDDDAIPEIDWIERLVECIKDSDAVFGKVISRTFSLPKPIKVLSEIYDTMIGCNMAFRKNVLMKVGLFNEKIDYGGEEDELIQRLIEQGYKVKVCLTAVVRHDFAKSYKNLFWKVYKGGKSSLLIKRNRIRRIAREKIIRTLFLRREYITIFILFLLFIIRRAGIIVGKIEFKLRGHSLDA